MCSNTFTIMFSIYLVILDCKHLWMDILRSFIDTFKNTFRESKSQHKKGQGGGKEGKKKRKEGSTNLQRERKGVAIGKTAAREGGFYNSRLQRVTERRSR